MNLSPIPLAVRSTCPYCGVGCGVTATPLPDGAIAIAGDKAHPANQGKLCVKGAALGETIDLGGRYLLPGLWDAHTHFASWSMMRQRLNLEGVESALEVGERVALRHQTHPGTLVGFGWRGSLWEQGPHFSILDAACPDEEVYLFSGDGHSVWLNTRALEVRGHAGPGQCRV